MIPNYPQFSALHLDHQKELEEFIQSFPPHSDYNLASLWSYDTDNAIQISMLHGNLVVIFRDYVTNEPVISFLGNTRVDQTIQTLLSYAQTIHLSPAISLLAEDTIAAITSKSDYILTEDRDNFDYIVSTDEIVQMKGTKYLKKRTKIHAFEREYGSVIQPIFLDISQQAIQQSIMELFTHWETQQQRPPNETHRERAAIEKIFLVRDKFSLHSLGLTIHNRLIGFAIDEVIHHGHGVTHFEKADLQFRGIYEYLKRHSAIHLQKLGCNYINLEQDLGIEGLRAAKMAYRPVYFIKKYTVKPKIP